MKRFWLRSQQGYILVMALLVSLLALSLGSAAVSKAVAAGRMTGQSAGSTQAFYLASAGIEDVVNRVASSYAFPSGASTYGPVNLGAGSYQVQVTYDGINAYSFVSTGTVGNTRRTVQAAGTGYGFNSVIFVFGGSTTADWDRIDVNGALVGGTVYPAVVYHNGSLNIRRGTLGGFISGRQVDANLYAVRTLTLGRDSFTNQPNCSVSGSPWRDRGRDVTLYGTGTGCWTGGTFNATDYNGLKLIAQTLGFYTTTCPRNSGNPLVLSQPANPNPYNNYIYFIDCSGYSGTSGSVTVGTDDNGLAGSFTLVIYRGGNSRITGLNIDQFIARPGANLGIVSDVPNQTIDGGTVSAYMRFDATSGRTIFGRDTVINGTITTYDLDTSGRNVTINVTPVISEVPPGFTNFSFTNWSN